MVSSGFIAFLLITRNNPRLSIDFLHTASTLIRFGRFFNNYKAPRIKEFYTTVGRVGAKTQGPRED